MEEDINGYSIVPITTGDIKDIQLREADIMEIYATGFTSIHEALVASVESSEEAYAVLIDDTQEALFGVTIWGVIWFVSSDKIFESYRNEFIRMSFEVLYDWQYTYGVLHNYVMSSNTKAIRWLQGLGFTVEDTTHEWRYFRRE